LPALIATRSILPRPRCHRRYDSEDATAFLPSNMQSNRPKCKNRGVQLRVASLNPLQ
jgi:hypothetical protein